MIALKNVTPSARHKALGLLCIILFALLLYRGVYRAIAAPVGDFGNYYTSARLALHGQFGDPAYYEFYRFNQALLQHYTHVLGGFLPHPPATVLPVMPFALLAPDAAKLAFNSVTVVLLVIIILLLAQLAQLDWRSVGCLTLLCGNNLWNNFLQGQFYVLMLFTIVAGLWLWGRGHRFWAGVMLGLMIPIKYFAVIYVLYFLAKREWQLLLGATLSAAGIALLGLVFTSPEFYRVYFTTVLPQHLATRIQDPFTAGFQSYTSLFNRLFVPEPSLNAAPALAWPFAKDVLKPFTSLVFLACTLLGIRAFEAHEADPRQRTLHAASLLTLFGLVNSPATATYHLVLLILPVVCFTSLAIQRDKRLPLALLLAYIVISFFPFGRLARFEDSGWLTLLAYTRLFVLTACFFASLPRLAIGVRRIGIGLGLAVLVACASAWLKPPPATDAAVWAGYDGLILRELSEQPGELFFVRSQSDGFVAVANGVPTSKQPPAKRALSRNGRFMLFEADVRSGLTTTKQIFVRDIQTQAVTQLSFAEGKSIEPIWSSDDSRIYFLSDRGRGMDCTTIYFLDAAFVRKATHPGT